MLAKFCKQSHTDHVQDMGLMFIRVVVTKNGIFPKNYLQVGLQCRCQRAYELLLIAQAAYGCLAACWAGVSQPSSLLLN